MLLPAAQKLTIALTAVSEKLPQLFAAQAKGDQFTQGLLTAASDVNTFNAFIQQANDQLGVFGRLFIGTFSQLTEQEFKFAKGAVAAGASMEQVRTVVVGLRDNFLELDRTMEQLPGRITATAQEIQLFKDAASAMALTGPDGAAAAKAIIDAVSNGEETVQSATARMQEYTTAVLLNNAVMAANAAETANAAAAIIEEVNALNDAAREANASAIASDELKQKQQEIYNAALAAALGMNASGNAALDMANKFGFAEQEAAKLIDRLRNLRIAQGLAEAKTTSESNFVGINALAGRAVDLQAFRNAQDSLDKLNDAQRDLAFSTADGAGQLKILRGELSKLGVGTEAYIRKQIEISKLEESLDKKKKKGAKNPKLTANEKLHNQLLAAEDKFNNQMEDLEENHQKRLLNILEDYNEKQLEAQRQNEVSKRRSRFDFYSNLNKSDLAPIDKQKFAAEYEAAFAEAQRLAQEGKKALSKEFLDLRQSQIEEMQQLAQEAADIRSDDSLSKGEKNARLAELEARKRLLEEAQSEELKNLTEGGDKLQNELQKRLDDETQAYADQAEKIAEQAQRAGDAKIAAAERNKIKVEAENKAYADQLGLLDQIRAKNGGKPLDTTPAVTDATRGTPPEVQPVNVTTPVPIDTTKPIPVETPAAITIRQIEMLTVRDQDVINAIGDQTARLEGKLSELIGTVNTMNGNVSSRLDSVRSALSTIKAVKP